MSQAAKAHEPSMEEILASIRRIIADDESGKTPLPKPPPAPVAPPQRPAAIPPRVVAPPPSSPPPPAQPPSPALEQSAVDAMLAGERAKAMPTIADGEAQDILDLTESMEAPVADAEAANFQTI